MRALLWAALFLLAAGGARADTGWRERWTSLWQTADQRGEQHLRQGDAAAAAHTYSDPRRRAYAELQAGDYQAAARDFAAFDDSDAHYNRGNALAHAGDLAGALEAYDTALARDPSNRDARHNRDLVAQAMKKQSPPPPSGGKGGNGGGGKEQPAKQNAQQGGKRDQQQKGEDRADAGGQRRDGQDKPDEQDGRKQRDQAGKAGAGRNPPITDNAAQALRDAEAGLRQQAEAHARARLPGEDERGPRAAAEAVPNERQLARDQWLRQIPDDPGGLLRRKFMIEHLMRQQGNQQ